MKSFVILAFSVLLTACASAPPLKANVADLDKSQSVVLQDLHPADEKKREIFSYLITSERYGIFRLGEMDMSPSAMRLLQHRVYEHFHASGPVDIKVHHFVVYLNQQHSFRAGAIGAALGPLGTAAAMGSVKDLLDGSFAVVDPNLFNSMSGDDEWKRGVMSLQENPNDGPAFIVWLDVEINGKRVFVRGVSPMKVPEGKAPYIVALESTYDFLLRQF